MAGPLFAGAFTVIGATREGYDWRRYPVSSLSIGRSGWLQRLNFVVAGLLYSGAALGLAQSPKQKIGPSAIPLLVAGAGLGLVGSGVFVTDPVGGYPSGPLGGEQQRGLEAVRTAPTREGMLHNLCAIPIFVGIPIAACASATPALRNRDYRWFSYSAGSIFLMVATFVVFGKSFAGAPNLEGKGGFFQRLSIASGFGWLTALSIRARPSRRFAE
jgi:hypothetical protein